MKIKKTLAIIMAAALTVGTMAGCSQATLNYSKEVSNTAKWEATTSDYTGALNIDAQGVKEEVTFTGTAYQVKDQAYIDMKFNNTSGKIKMPELKEYVSGNTIYINKSYFEGISTMAGQAVPEELSKIQGEFIAIDSSAAGLDMNKLRELATQPDAMVQLGKLVFGDNNDLDLPFTQNGREYTMNLDADKTVDLSAKAIKSASNNLDKLNTTFLGSKLTTENIAKIKTAVNDAKFNAALPQIKTALAGSAITSKIVFTDNNCTSDFNMNLQVKDFGKVALAMKSTCVKSDAKAITIPTSVTKITKEEYVKISMPANKTVATTSNVVAK